jgi:putative ABC transport system permease protein
VTPVSSWGMMSLPLSWEDGAQSQMAESVPVNFVGGEFFQTMRIPITLGKGLETDDALNGARFAVISQKTAVQYYGKQNPVGRHVRLQELNFEIIGVAGDVHYLDPRVPVDDRVYLPYSEFINLAAVLPEGFNVEVRSSRSLADVASAIRTAVARVNSSAQTINIRTERSQINDDLSEERITAVLATIVNFVLLIVTTIAVYGVVAQGVSQRKQEFAVRLVLGASYWDIAARPLLELAYLLIIALALVGPTLLAGFRLILHSNYSQLVNNLRMSDVASAGILALSSVCSVCVIGAALPVIRTLRISPSQVLRAE